jgi:hypothetical protein
MEQAYSAKEKEVEKELGTMRDQFTQELRVMAARSSVARGPKIFAKFFVAGKIGCRTLQRSVKYREKGA